ncbi:DNA polymerase III subunit gamma/tau [Acetobacteraceae bacterium ESL0709]|nr:DNA polymerase III subunit gamma/tau [Acetobacteraceae bacterium ESL0697]MDF7677279.1 DNA polymerase III subunit gamma/tau [Acetobacteraceae bacterium ESL0709]
MDDDTLPLPQEEGTSFFPDAGSVGRPISETEKPQHYKVLARKYRPRTFDDLIGQDTLVRILRRAFEVGRVAHAFMLTGVRGVGKTTTARIIARALNCTGRDGKGGPTADPCGVCPNCVAILEDRHPDVLEMDAASRTGVDDVREIIEFSRFRPMQGRMKVFIIDEVHMLSRNAFNALLKTLEEPPAQVTFIFATTELRKVPVTVLSRCQRFDLHRVPQDQLAEHFKNISEKEGAHFTSEALALIARAADGSVRDGLSLLDQAIAQGAEEAGAVSAMLGLADRGLIFDMLESVMAGKADQVLALTEKAYAQGADLRSVLTDLMEGVHLLSRFKVDSSLRESNDLPEMERSRGGSLCDRLSMSVLSRAWQMLLKGVAEVDAAPDRRQAVEMVLIRLCYSSVLPTPDELIRQLQGETSPVPAGNTSRAVSAFTAQSSSSGMASMSVPVSEGSHGPVVRSSLRLVVNGGAIIEHETPELVASEETEELPVPMPKSWREMVVLVGQEKEAWLHGILRHEAHIVRFGPPDLVLRLDDIVVRKRVQRTLSALLERLYPGQWRLDFSEEKGEPSLDEQGAQVVALNQQHAQNHPLIRAVMKRFPGARIASVHDRNLDDYGLPPEEMTPLGEDYAPDLDFAPYDADSINENDLD